VVAVVVAAAVRVVTPIVPLVHLVLAVMAAVPVLAVYTGKAVVEPEVETLVRVVQAAQGVVVELLVELLAELAGQVVHRATTSLAAETLHGLAPALDWGTLHDSHIRQSFYVARD
jgi:hypothetical protein